MDEGNHDTLQFENEHIGDITDSDEEEFSHTKYLSIYIISSMDNPHPSMDKISVDRNTSLINPHQET